MFLPPARLIVNILVEDGHGEHWLRSEEHVVSGDEDGIVDGLEEI